MERFEFTIFTIATIAFISCIVAGMFFLATYQPTEPHTPLTEVQWDLIDAATAEYRASIEAIDEALDGPEWLAARHNRYFQFLRELDEIRKR